MTLTTLDEKTALVLIDLQQGIVAMPTAHASAGIVHNARRLADAFRARKLPVVLVNVTRGAPGRVEQSFRTDQLPATWSELVPELDPQPDDLRITKANWGALINTDLTVQLKALGVTQLVIGGISTSIGVESTARQAYELGFNVTLATDAMTDRNADAHANSVTRIFPRLGECGTTADVLDLLARTHP